MRILKWVGSIVIVVLLILAALYYLGTENQSVKASATMPTTIFVDEPFTLTLTLKNQTDSEREVVSVGLEDTFLQQGIEVIRAVPEYRTVEDEGAWHSFVFARRRRPLLAPNGENVIQLTLIVTQQGRYDTRVVLWFNNQLQGVYVPIHLEAIAHPTPWLGR